MGEFGMKQSPHFPEDAFVNSLNATKPMKLLLQTALFLQFTFNILHSSMALAPRIPLRDFFKNPEKTGYQISPDGKWISYLAPYERRLNVFVMPRSGGEAKRVTGETARDLAGYFWKSNDRIIY